MSHGGKDLPYEPQQIAIGESTFANLNQINPRVGRATAQVDDFGDTSGIGR
jgi:hypothetical protein